LPLSNLLTTEPVYLIQVSKGVLFDISPYKGLREKSVRNRGVWHEYFMNIHEHFYKNVKLMLDKR